MSSHSGSVEQRALPGGATLTTVRGTRPGPTLALLGGVHGDEDEGVLAVHRVLREAVTAPLAGTLRAVAPAHPAAWAAHSRTGPLDGANLARGFPGDPAGGFTAALAAGITEKVIAGADLLLDLHSAGVRYEMPLFCGFTRDTAQAPAAERAALAFGAPLIWEHPRGGPGRSLSAAAQHGVPGIYAECAGGGGILSGELDAYVQGVLNVLAELGMRPSGPGAPAGRPRRVFGDGDLDDGAQTDHDGFFSRTVRAGEVVEAGAEIGRCYGDAGQLLDVVRAPRRGMVMFLRRQARIREGDVVFVLARLDEGGR